MESRCRTTCRLDIRYFPYDQQNCTLVISSWTSSKSDLDYEAEFDDVNLDNFIPNEEWVVVSFHIRRVEVRDFWPFLIRVSLLAQNYSFEWLRAGSASPFRGLAAKVRLLSRALGPPRGVACRQKKAPLLHWWDRGG